MIEARDRALTVGFYTIMFVVILGLTISCVSAHNKHVLINTITDNRDSLTF